jgi:hypothetical protein
MGFRDEAVDLAVMEQERLAGCKLEMDAVMKKYACKLDVGLIIRPGKIEPLVRIVPDPKFILAPQGNKNSG